MDLIHLTYIQKSYLTTPVDFTSRFLLADGSLPFTIVITWSKRWKNKKMWKCENEKNISSWRTYILYIHCVLSILILLCLLLIVESTLLIFRVDLRSICRDTLVIQWGKNGSIWLTWWVLTLVPKKYPHWGAKLIH